MAEAYFTATTHDKFIPDVWEKSLIAARESVLIMANLVRRLDVNVSQHGDVIHLPLLSNLSAGDISTSTGALDATAPTETEVTLTINKWKGVAINVLDIVKAQSMYDIMSEYAKKMGYALGVALEDDLTVLAASLSQTVGTFNTDLTDANIRRAVQYLDDARVPFSDRHLVIKPAQKNNLLGIDKFVRYDSIAYAKGESPILKGNMGELYGVMVHVTPEVYKTSSNTSNMMIHRECLGLAVQKDVKVEQFARTAFTDRMGASNLYGVAELRDDHGVELRS
jgi:hypothetical protein